MLDRLPLRPFSSAGKSYRSRGPILIEAAQYRDGVSTFHPSFRRLVAYSKLPEEGKT
jgi:hypothetical protein